jgi:hypothetical protein
VPGYFCFFLMCFLLFSIRGLCAFVSAVMIIKAHSAVGYRESCHTSACRFAHLREGYNGRPLVNDETQVCASLPVTWSAYDMLALHPMGAT